MVRQIFQWSLAGRGQQDIAALLNRQGVPNPARYKAERGWTCNHPVKNDHGLWDKTPIWRILRNKMYTEVMIQGRRKKVSYTSKAIIDTPEDQGYRVEGTHEAIIDRLIELVSDRVRAYVRTYYELDAKDIQPKKDTRRESLEQERKTIAAQLEKRSQVLKALYLDKVAGAIGEGQSPGSWWWA